MYIGGGVGGKGKHPHVYLTFLNLTLRTKNHVLYHIIEKCPQIIKKIHKSNTSLVSQDQQKP